VDVLFCEFEALKTRPVKNNNTSMNETTKKEFNTLRTDCCSGSVSIVLPLSLRPDLLMSDFLDGFSYLCLI
jgi:hypothetical protein